MAVAARCLRKGCELAFDDAEFVDDAIAKLRAHFRDEHPTKAFYENRYLEDIEIYNESLDEYIERYVGIPNWRDQNADGRHTRHIQAACQQVIRSGVQHFRQEILDAAEALIAELGGAPQPNIVPPAAPDPFGAQVARGVVEFIQDGVIDPAIEGDEEF